MATKIETLMIDLDANAIHPLNIPGACAIIEVCVQSSTELKRVQLNIVQVTLPSRIFICNGVKMDFIDIINAKFASAKGKSTRVRGTLIEYEQWFWAEVGGGVLQPSVNASTSV